MELVKCVKCNKEKGRDSFWKSVLVLTNAKCKSCLSDYQKGWRERRDSQKIEKTELKYKPLPKSVLKENFGIFY